MNLERISALVASIGTATTPLLAFLGVCVLALDRYAHRKMVLRACPGCAEKLKAHEPPKVTVLLVVMGVCYVVNVLVAARGGAQVAELPPAAPVPTPASTIERQKLVKSCGYDDCEKKTNCKCVSDQCRCGAVDELAPPAPPPAPKKKKKKPLSSLASTLPAFAGKPEPPWFANLPVNTAPLAREL